MIVFLKLFLDENNFCIYYSKGLLHIFLLQVVFHSWQDTTEEVLEKTLYIKSLYDVYT